MIIKTGFKEKDKITQTKKPPAVALDNAIALSAEKPNLLKQK